MNARREYLPDPAPDRLPPHSLDAEQGVLGCIFLAASECMARCNEHLRAGSAAFYDLRHQLLYATLREMSDAGQGIDVITVQQKLKDRGDLERVGGIGYLASLPDLVPSAANLDHYLAIVREKYMLRRLVHYYTESIARVYEHDGPVDELLLTVETEIAKLTEVETVAQERHIKTLLIEQVMPEIEAWAYHRGSQQVVGLTTGPAGNYLDKLLGGIPGDRMVLLAGRPGSGKTSFALNIVKHISTQHVWWEPISAEAAAAGGEGISKVEPEGQEAKYFRRRVGLPVAVFSLEMSGESLAMQLLFDEAGVDMAQYKQGFKKKMDDPKLVAAAGRLAKANIYIDDCAGSSVDVIAGKARRMAKQYGIALFVLDYVQLVATEDRAGDRVREMTRVSNKIVALKKQLGIPWLVLAQMNRNIETAERDRRPVMSDLKDSGAFEQDADIIIFTYKLSAKEANQERKGPKGEGLPSDQELIEEVVRKEKLPWSEVPARVDFVVAKNRYGPTGDCRMLFQKNLRHFEDWELWLKKKGLKELAAGERPSVILGDEPGRFDDVAEEFPS